MSDKNTDSFDSFSHLFDAKEEEEDKKEPQFYNDLPLDPEWVLPLKKNIFGELVFFYPIRYQSSNFNQEKENLRKRYKFKYPVTREQGEVFKPIKALEVANGKEPNDSSPLEKELVHLFKAKKNEYEQINEYINNIAILQRQIERIKDKIINSKHVIHDLTKKINEVSNKLIETNEQQIKYNEFQDWF